MTVKIKPAWSRSATPEDAPSMKIATDPQQAARFIADMALELRNIANRAGLGVLTQILEMAFIEALDVSNRPKASTRRPLPLAKGE